MRKQTKVVAVASAAALLAIGGAMTSFAAQGWVEEDGTWYFYDKDGSRVEDTWKKSGDNLGRENSKIKNPESFQDLRRGAEGFRVLRCQAYQYPVDQF